MSINNNFWIWGQFSKEDTNYLNKIKTQVQSVIKSPKFEPHLTLAGPFLKVDTFFLKKLKLFCKNKNSIILYLKSFNYEDEIFKSLYISIFNSEKLEIIRKEISSEYKIDLNNLYNPHISLAYGDHQTHEKIKIISRLSTLRDSVKMTKLSLVDVNETKKSWKILKSFDFYNTPNLGFKS